MEVKLPGISLSALRTDALWPVADVVDKRVRGVPSQTLADPSAGVVAVPTTVQTVPMPVLPVPLVGQ